MILPSLTTHAEKISFVRNYVESVKNAELGSAPSPLMIIGKGGEGKSKVVQEVRLSSEIPILVLQDNIPSFTLGSSTNIAALREPPYVDNFAVILINLGQPEDFKMADYMKATIVEFKPDPSMSSTVYY